LLLTNLCWDFSATRFQNSGFIL